MLIVYLPLTSNYCEMAQMRRTNMIIVNRFNTYHLWTISDIFPPELTLRHTCWLGNNCRDEAEKSNPDWILIIVQFTCRPETWAKPSSSFWTHARMRCSFVAQSWTKIFFHLTFAPLFTTLKLNFVQLYKKIYKKPRFEKSMQWRNIYTQTVIEKVFLLKKSFLLCFSADSLTKPLWSSRCRENLRVLRESFPQQWSF